MIKMKKEFKHIIIEDFDTGFKKGFHVTNKHDGYSLGDIYYYNKWKKWAFDDGNIYDESCLLDIAKFLHSIELS